MRTFIIASSLLCAALTSCREIPPRRPLAGHVVAVCDSVHGHGRADTVRFGRLREGETAVLPLRLVNRSSRPVVPLDCRCVCGCTRLEFDRRPLLPGDTAGMTLLFDSRGLWGWQLKPVELLFSEGRSLRILAEAEVE